MNNYQKLATLLLRLVGAVAAVMGVMGPFYVFALVLFGQKIPAYAPNRWAGCIVWAIGGLLLVMFAKPLGRLFGRGLD